MAKAFPSARRGFPRALKELRDAILGSIVADWLPLTSGASPLTVDASVFETRVTSGGTQGNEVVRIPAGTKVGQRHLVTFLAEGDASDVVRINAAAGAALQSQGSTGETPAAATNVDLDTPGEFALLEFQGGATPTWNILYTTGAIS